MSPDEFRLLAGSARTRWSALHVTHRDSRRTVEAWVHRPGRVTVRDPRRSALIVERGWEYPPQPAQDSDDVAMYENYRWVAMLDPVELSHHVRVSDVAATEVAARPAWSAYLVAEEGYEPRCGGNCCELLFSEVARFSETGSDLGPPPADWVYPDGYRVSLDAQTGVVVRLRPDGGNRDDLWFDLDVLAVDDDVAPLEKIR